MFTVTAFLAGIAVMSLGLVAVEAIKRIDGRPRWKPRFRRSHRAGTIYRSTPSQVSYLTSPG